MNYTRIDEDEMGGACCTHGTEGNAYSLGYKI